MIIVTDDMAGKLAQSIIDTALRLKIIPSQPAAADTTELLQILGLIEACYIEIEQDSRTNPPPEIVRENFTKWIDLIAMDPTNADHIIEQCADLVSQLGPRGGGAWSSSQHIVHEATHYAADVLRSLKQV